MLLEGGDQLVADARDYLEQDALPVLESWAALEAAARVPASSRSLAREARDHDSDSGSSTRAVDARHPGVDDFLCDVVDVIDAHS